MGSPLAHPRPSSCILELKMTRRKLTSGLTLCGAVLAPALFLLRCPPLPLGCLAVLRLPATIAAVLIVSAAAAVRGQAPFESVSITPSDGGLIDVQFFPNRVVARTVTLSELIEQAYGLQPWEVVDGPDWVRVDRFTITAVAGADVGRDRMKLMLQSLLADRFQLQLARDTRTGAVYRLSARKVRGLKAARPNERSVITADLRDDAGFLSYHYQFRNTTMSTLARTLPQHLGAPVIDQTQLTGAFDFRTHFAYDDAFGHRLDSDVPTIMNALEKQLGLTLVAGTAAVPVHVIVRVSRPSTN